MCLKLKTALIRTTRNKIELKENTEIKVDMRRKYRKSKKCLKQKTKRGKLGNNQYKGQHLQKTKEGKCKK